MGTITQSEIQQPGVDVNHPTPSIDEVKEKVELYF
jgi:hypothetical protein